MSQTFLPLLRKAADQKKASPLSCERAAIINMSYQFKSIQSSVISLKCYHYRAARAALCAITTLMAMELQQYGILAAAMHPGWADVGAVSEQSIGEERERSMNKIWSTIIDMNEHSRGMMYNYDGMVMPW